MNKQLYKCIKDLQGSDFCVGIMENENEWRNRAIEWEINNYNVQSTIETLNKLAGQELIDFISEMYDLKIVPIN